MGRGTLVHDTREGGESLRIERTIDVHTTPVKAYKVLSDPTNIPRFAPDVEDVVITSITPRLVGTTMTMRTLRHDEIEAEVTEASIGKGCAFHAKNGRHITWSIRNDQGAVKLVNTFETPEALDENQVVPELERKLRVLRSAFQMR